MGRRWETRMRLTQWTDYALRVLMYCAAHQDREAAPTIAEIAEAYGISRSHLMKVVMALSAKGWLAPRAARGRPAAGVAARRDRGGRGGAPDGGRLHPGGVLQPARQQLPH